MILHFISSNSVDFGVEIMVWFSGSDAYYRVVCIFSFVSSDVMCRSGSRAFGNRLWSASSAKDAGVEG